MRSILARPDIDELWVMPSAKRADKPFMSGDATRLALLQCVKEHSFSDDERLVISTFEMELPYQTETYKTLEALKATYPNDHFQYVFGADSYQDMPNWHHGNELMQTMGMLLVARVGYELPDETDTIKHLFVPRALELHTSSSELRQSVIDGKTISDRASTAVVHFVRDHRLYLPVQ
jgi:nicotinate-nucleotide adenylyltransferase